MNLNAKAVELFYDYRQTQVLNELGVLNAKARSTFLKKAMINLLNNRYNRFSRLMPELIMLRHFVYISLIPIYVHE